MISGYLRFPEVFNYAHVVLEPNNLVMAELFNVRRHIGLVGSSTGRQEEDGVKLV